VDADQLFVHTLEDLERYTASADEYEVLMSAAMLRKLLLDKGRRDYNELQLPYHGGRQVLCCL
jgi:hypothetical protein